MREAARSTRRLRLALFSPMPPQISGIADYTNRLLPWLAEGGDVDVFVDGHAADFAPVDAPQVRLLDARRFESAGRAGYDHVLYCLGNSRFHAYMWRWLAEHPGDVLAHDVRFIDLYRALAGVDGQPTFRAKLGHLYGDRIAPELLDAWGRDGVPWEGAARFGVYMAREVLAPARRVFVHGEAARRIVLAESGRDARVVPYGFPAPSPAPGAREPAVIASFGSVHAIKGSDLLFDAFVRVRRARPQASLVFVGWASESDQRALRERARQLGVEDGLVFTGLVPRAEYDRRLREVTVAVQLRRSTHGEMSAAVTDCLAAGIPTVVSEIGPLAELTSQAAVHLPLGADAPALATILIDLLDDPARRRRLGDAALAHAASNGFARAAARLWELMRA